MSSAENSDQASGPATVKGRNRVEHGLDVLLRHRLLRQSGGPPSCCAIHISLHPHHPSIAHFEDDRRVVLQLDSAASSTPVFVQKHHYVVTGVEELLRLEAALLPGLAVLFVVLME